MSQLLTVSVVKNEADKFLPSALECWGDFSDHVLILDDNSKDNTAAICKEAGAEVIKNKNKKHTWGNETPLRAKLWDAALARTNPGDWIFILDADMIPAKDPRHLLQEHVDSVAFVLYDLWTEYSDGLLMYRSDHFWQGHLHPRIWLVRHPEPQEWQWSGRGIHSGHLPLNLGFDNTIFAPLDYGLFHYAYINPQLRNQKFQQYSSVKRQLNDFEIAHAASIGDNNPNLKPITFHPQYKLTCAS